MTNNKKKNGILLTTLNMGEQETIKTLYDMMCQEGLTDLSVEEAGVKITIKRRRETDASQDIVSSHTTRKHAVHQAEVTTADAAKKQTEPSLGITTPLIGIFYRSSSPSSESYVREGQTVEAGSIVCIIEAMKVMNEIRAEKNCRIKKILVENGKPVTAGQVLFEIEHL